MVWCYYLVVVKGEGRDMENWERALMESDNPAVEVITRSEFERVVDECDVVPLNVVVVEDE